MFFVLPESNILLEGLLHLSSEALCSTLDDGRRPVQQRLKRVFDNRADVKQWVVTLLLVFVDSPPLLVFVDSVPGNTFFLLVLNSMHLALDYFY